MILVLISIPPLTHRRFRSRRKNILVGMLVKENVDKFEDKLREGFSNLLTVVAVDRRPLTK